MITRKEREHQLRQLLNDDGEAAKNHLAAGRPIVYCDDEVSKEYIIREWPDGHLELINVDQDGNVTVIREL